MTRLRRRKNLILLLASVLVSGVGTGATLTAVGWLLVDRFLWSSNIALMSVLAMLFSFAVLPAYSSFVDRVPRKRIFYFLYGSGAALQLCGALYFFRHEPVFAGILFLGAFSQAMRSFDQVCRTALAQEVAGGQDYAGLNRALEVVRQLTTFLSGGAAVLLFKNNGIAPVFLVDALSYVLGGVLIALIRVPKTAKISVGATTPKTGFFAGLKSAREELRSQSGLFASLALTLLPYSMIVAQNVLYPAHFKSFLHAGPQAFALMSLPYGLGACLAAPVSRYLGSRWPRRRVIFFGFALFLTSVIALMSYPSVILTDVCLIFCPLANALVRIERATLLMESVENRLMGRVTGLFEFLFLISSGFLTVILGAIADIWNVQAAWGVVTASMGMGSLALLWTGKKKSGFGNKKSPEGWFGFRRTFTSRLIRENSGRNL